MPAAPTSFEATQNTDNNDTKGPLSGLLVLDLTRVLAGPYCTMMLADLGARVIKIERPKVGDDARQFGPFIKAQSAYFMSLNRGKESLALDLKSADDRAIFEELLNNADILVENFRPGTMEKFGYGWEALHIKHPRLIYAAISGFGQTGPYAKRPAYDLVVQGMGGLMSITGQPNTPPTRVGTSIGDITAALFTSNGIIAALYHREQTQLGMQVDISMLDCQVAILENAIARFTATQETPTPLGARHPSITPFDAFATQDGYIVIAAGNDELFAKICEVIGRTELIAHPLFQTNPLRTQHVAKLKQELETTLRTNSTEHWLAQLQQNGVPCGPINDIPAILDDPQIKARNMIITTHDPIAGDVQMAGNPIKFSAFDDPKKRQPAPQLNQHRDKINDDLCCD